MLKNVFLLCLAFALVASQNTGNNELLQAINTALSKWQSGGSAGSSWQTWYGNAYNNPNCPSNTYPATPTAGGTLASVINRGVLNIGSDLPSPPLYFTNSGNSTVVGFDQDFANFLASELSTQYKKTITANRVVTPFANLLSQLDNTSWPFDVASGGMLVTPDRLQLANFACNISFNQLGGLVLNATRFPDVNSILQSGVNVGVLAGSTQAGLVANSSAHAVNVNDINDAVNALNNGTIDAYFTTFSTAQYYVFSNPTTAASALPASGATQGVAWAVRKDSSTTGSSTGTTSSATATTGTTTSSATATTGTTGTTTSSASLASASFFLIASLLLAFWF